MKCTEIWFWLIPHEPRDSLYVIMNIHKRAVCFVGSLSGLASARYLEDARGVLRLSIQYAYVVEL